MPIVCAPASAVSVLLRIRIAACRLLRGSVLAVVPGLQIADRGLADWHCCPAGCIAVCGIQHMSKLKPLQVQCTALLFGTVSNVTCMQASNACTCMCKHVHFYDSSARANMKQSLLQRPRPPASCDAEHRAVQAIGEQAIGEQEQVHTKACTRVRLHAYVMHCCHCKPGSVSSQGVPLSLPADVHRNRSTPQPLWAMSHHTSTVTTM